MEEARGDRCRMTWEVEEVHRMKETAETVEAVWGDSQMKMAAVR